MRLRRKHFLGPLKALSAPLLTAAVVTVAIGLHASSSSDIPTRTEQVELAATIDTASTAAGISDSSLYFMSQTDLDTAMQQLQTMGVTQIRVLLPWQSMEPADGTYSWTQADQLLNTAAKYGMAVEATITSTPTWATKYSAGGLIANGAPTSVADYASFVQAVAARYGSSNNDGTGLLSAIEVWNEPNGNTGWYPTPTAQGYTDLLKAAYTAIKSVAPDITVVGGVLGAGVTIGTWTVNPVTFLQQMYADGAAGYFDALSFHPYDYWNMFSTGNTFANSALQQLQALRALMDANGDAAKLIWATEYGEPSSETGGEAQQAAYIQDFLKTWSSLTGVGPMFIYSLLNDGSGNNLNIFGTNWTPKQAVAIIEAWLAAHPTDEDPTQSTPGTTTNPIAAVVQAITTAVNAVITNVATAVSNLANSISTALSNLLKALTSGVKKAAAAVAAAVTPKTGTGATAVAAAGTLSSAEVADASVAAASAEQTAAAVVSTATTATDDKTATTDKTTADSKTSTVQVSSSETTTDTTATATTDATVTAASDTTVTGTIDTATSTTTGTAASAGTASTGSASSAGDSATDTSATASTGPASKATATGAAATSTSGATSASSSTPASASASAGSSTTSDSTDNSSSSTSSSSDGTTTKKAKKDKKKTAGSKPSAKSGKTGPKSSAGASGSSSSNSSSNDHKSSHSSSKGKHHAGA